ncbi:Protein CBR-NAS-12 [Caenorhabditis briggsae]|uniref:Metalloendopeptidase n=1 Tax=Caenorhabditis briggsae TaxID=6238 RepID=A8WUY0_CAEBR|nr:Protein CBR-NAS-12 [Caenorhabditis briggsae]CAP24291.2 Protein CBR-NAS-12 [Caenorhabditis briggsae]
MLYTTDISLFFVILLNLCTVSIAVKQSWEINQDLVTNENKEHTVFGDMLLTPAQLLRYENSKDSDLTIRGVSIKGNSNNRWENNIVPFVISPQYSATQKKILISSLRYFERVSCFKFVDRTTQNDYLFIVPLDGCYSYVGKIGGRQALSLAADCIADYIIWHEMMHAIGFEHEHQRPDRDSFIRVDYSNVIPGQMINFDKLQQSQVEFPDSYDYKSIMHYDGYAFGRVDGVRQVRLATMIPLKPGVRLEDNMKFTATDIEKLNRLGQCGTRGGQYSNQGVVAATCKDVATAISCEGNRRVRSGNAAYTVILNSELQRGMCKNPFYKQMMIKSCQKTCRLCSYARSIDEDENLTPNTTRKPLKCEDKHPRCDVYSQNGFCSLPFYDDVRYQLCAKTCNLC